MKPKPLYDVRKAREPIRDKQFELIYEMVPQDEFISDGNFDQWIDEETADAVRAKVKNQVGSISLNTVEDIFSVFDL